jgi:hypothetical protein
MREIENEAFGPVVTGGTPYAAISNGIEVDVLRRVNVPEKRAEVGMPVGFLLLIGYPQT